MLFSNADVILLCCLYENGYDMKRYIKRVRERFELGYCFDYAYLFIMQKLLHGTSFPKMDYLFLEALFYIFLLFRSVNTAKVQYLWVPCLNCTLIGLVSRVARHDANTWLPSEQGKYWCGAVCWLLGNGLAVHGLKTVIALWLWFVVKGIMFFHQQIT